MGNKKKIIFMSMFVLFVLSLSIVSAANDMNTDGSINDVSVLEQTKVQKDAKVIKDTSKEKSFANNVKEKKEIKKEKKTDEYKKKDSIIINGIEYTNVVENQVINSPVTYTENTYINNSTFNCDEEYALLFNHYGKTSLINNSKINAFLCPVEGDVFITNSILSNAFYVWASNVYIDDSVTLTESFYLYEEGNSAGKIYTNNPQLIQKLTEANIDYFGLPLDGNKEINDVVISEDTSILESGNVTIINSIINAKITNNGNITLINCSLSNNNLATSVSKMDGFLLENKGNSTLIGCIIENNTFNTTGNVNVYGAIVNNGVLNVVDTVSRNNSLGYYRLDEDNPGLKYGTIVGKGSVIANLGTLTVESSNFTDNYAGESGGAIYNEGNLTITNSLFENNLANAFGGAISSKYYETSMSARYDSQMEIKNTIFKNNQVDLPLNMPNDLTGGGAIHINQANTTIQDCTFENNSAITSVTGLMGVTAQGGSIAISRTRGRTSYSTINIQNSAFSNHTTDIIQNGKWGLDYLNGNIINCIFENNNGGIKDIGNLNITCCTFKNTSDADAVIYNHIRNGGQIKTISNNQFIDNILNFETIYTHITGDFNPDQEVLEIISNNNIYINTTIDDTLSLKVPNKIYTGEPITITGTYNINNPKNYDEDILEQTQFNIFINGELNQTVDTLEFTVTPASGTMMVTVQPTISHTRKTQAIRATTLTDVVITPENYNEYIYEGALVGVSKDSKIMFQGTFTDKGKIFIDIPDIIIDGTNATFTNTMFNLEASGNTLQNMNINNIQTEYPIQNTKDNNTITGNTITLVNTEGKTAAIYNKASNTEITNNIIYVDGPAGDIDHEGSGVCTTQAILLIGGNQNTVENNNITITSTSSTTSFGTIEGITNSKQATNTIIKGNKLNVSGGMFNYAINSLTNIVNMTITENNILVTGERYTDGIQVGDNAENINITKNNITCYCLNTTPIDQAGITYGIITTRQNGKASNNINITENNIQLTGRANYGMEIYETTNTRVTDNKITLTGIKSMGIGYAHSPNSTITGNTIITNDNSTTPLTGIVEEIQPQNVGIQLQQESDNILIEDNTIQTYDVAAQDNCINVESNNVTIKNNNLTSSTQTGDNTITTTQPDTTTIEDNTAIEQNSTTQTTTEDLTVGDSTTITAQFYDDTYTPVGEGKAIFRVNGKTLRYDDGTVIFADVINGRAELPNVNITQEWMKPGTTIQAVYMGDNNNEPIITTPTNVTVTKPEATISLDVPTEALAGQEITLKANVTDGVNAISSGRVAFKLNGKTLKNAEGKALYANVENGIATITYTIPEKTKAKDYVLTAVFTDSATRQESNSLFLIKSV